MFKKILIPTDGSELSTKAINGAIAFAKASPEPKPSDAYLHVFA